MQEGVFLEADVHEHRLEAVLDVSHPALEDAPTMLRSVSRSVRVFLEAIVFQQRDALFKPLATDNEFVPGVLLSQA